MFSACNDYINDVDPFIDRVEDDLLNNESQISFLIKGVQGQFAVAASSQSGLIDLLSDQMLYDVDVPTATFQTFNEIDKGDIPTSNTNITNQWTTLCQFRFLADNLLSKVEKITFTSEANRSAANYSGYLFGGIARFWMAISFGRDINTPGGVISTDPKNPAPFTNANALLDDAIARYKKAIENTTNAAEKRIINSLIAKAYFAKKEYANALPFAQAGMLKNDAAFNALNSLESSIWYYGFAGLGRVQIILDPRFKTYVDQDPKEVSRIQYEKRTGTSGRPYYVQTKYPTQATSFPIMTWQENHLMLAELKLLGQGSANELSLVNEVRASHQLDPLTVVNADVIYVERDKELMCQGTRLMDQNRLNKFHMTGNSWRYLPIPRNEYNSNPNL